MADKTVNNVVRLLELMDIAPGSYDEETALDAIALIKAQQAEIERLRNLGDDMAYWYENLGPSMTMRDAVEAWKEARRG